LLSADENSLLEALPKKMKTDLAIHVHFNTLSKVKLFQVSSVAQSFWLWSALCSLILHVFVPVQFQRCFSLTTWRLILWFCIPM